MSKWIEFVDTGFTPSGKTRTWEVRSKAAKGEEDRVIPALGWIGWYAPWRRYSFQPASGTVFEATCLRDIAAFCEEQTKLHKARA